jgi:hypothetical protein
MGWLGDRGQETVRSLLALATCSSNLPRHLLTTKRDYMRDQLPLTLSGGVSSVGGAAAGGGAVQEVLREDGRKPT